ncbi:MAG: hypothetical protein K2P38_02100, partial [Lachnospiraceae bacterium]|nr:hypothetical protein [Lachnospiraceae bacterium]
AWLAHPEKTLIWMNAADPMQPWGKLLSHQREGGFANVQTTLVALRDGVPVALFERQGKTLRVLEKEGVKEALSLFVEQYKKGQVFADKKRILVREYPDWAEEALKESGFGREVQGYGVYR